MMAQKKKTAYSPKRDCASGVVSFALTSKIAE